MMTKFEILRKLQTKGSDVNFIANVILVQQRNPAKRLRGLLAILDAGDNSVDTSRDMTLFVNGNQLAWPTLELPLAAIAERVPLRFSAAPSAASQGR